MKKQKSIVALTTDPSTGQMLMEIVEPQKEEKFLELIANEFQIRMDDINILMHDSMVNIWKYTKKR